MSVLSLPTISHTQIYVSGDVMIDETAAIAPGVILQATGNGKIIIKAGACIGMGVVLTANQGTIEIGEGAILGAGVLIVGSGKISDRACIGTASTLIDTSVESRECVAPGSLLGDTSRPETPSPTSHSEPESNGSHSPPEPSPWEATTAQSENNGHQSPYQPKSPPLETTPEEAENNGHEVNDQPVEGTESPAPTSDNDHPPPSDSEQPPPSNTTIYGQTHIERLMVTLFPHKEKFKKEDE